MNELISQIEEMLKLLDEDHLIVVFRIVRYFSRKPKKPIGFSESKRGE